MLPPKAFLDAIGSQASRLFNGETPLPRGEFEAQLKGVVRGALNKLDVVSRDEFDSQMVVLACTRARPRRSKPRLPNWKKSSRRPRPDRPGRRHDQRSDRMSPP